jgi:hypothetical protein
VALGEENPSLQRLSRLVNDAAAGVRRLQEFSRVQYDGLSGRAEYSRYDYRGDFNRAGALLTDPARTQNGRRITFVR